MYRSHDTLFSSIAAFVLVIGLAPLEAAQPAKAPKTVARPAKVAPPSVEDLFEIGHDFCERGEYHLALWPLRKAADLSKKDPGPQLWLAHAMIQAGLVKEGKAKLAAVEKSLSVAKPKDGTSTSLYLACARNYLGVLAAIDKAKPQAAVWFDKAAGRTNAPTAQPPGSEAVKNTGETLPAQEQILRELAEGNRQLLDNGTAFTAWIPPVLPLPPSGTLKTGPGLAKSYIRAAEARWRTVSRQSPLDRNDNGGGSSDAGTTGRGSGPVAPARKPQVIPVTLQLLDASSAVTAARMSAEEGSLDEALRLGETARALQPDSVETCLLLADLYEAKNWLVEAVESLETAAAKATDDRKQAARDALTALAKANPELAMEPRGLLTSRNFRVRFSASPADAQAVLGLLEQAHQAAERAFPTAVPVVYVRLFPDKPSLLQYTALAKGRPPANWMAAYARPTGHGAEIMTTSQAGASALSHEYAHVVVHALAGPGDLPRWLDEGLAQVIEEGRQLASDLTRAAFMSNQLPGPDQIESFFDSEEKKRNAMREQVAVCYDAAKGATSFLLNTRGDAAVIEWLLAIRRGESADESFQRLFGLTPDQFFQLWAQTCLR